MSKPEEFTILVRRNGRVCLRTCRGPLLLGWVRRLNTNDGPAWFYSHDEDFSETEVGGLRRHEAVRALIDGLARMGK